MKIFGSSKKNEKKNEKNSMFIVKQYFSGKFWRKFYVTNKRSIRFWKYIAGRNDKMLQIETYIEEVK